MITFNDAAILTVAFALTNQFLADELLMFSWYALMDAIVLLKNTFPTYVRSKSEKSG